MSSGDVGVGSVGSVEVLYYDVVAFTVAAVLGALWIVPYILLATVPVVSDVGRAVGATLLSLGAPVVLAAPLTVVVAALGDDVTVGPGPGRFLVVPSLLAGLAVAWSLLDGSSGPPYLSGLLGAFAGLSLSTRTYLLARDDPGPFDGPGFEFENVGPVEWATAAAYGAVGGTVHWFFFGVQAPVVGVVRPPGDPFPVLPPVVSLVLPGAVFLAALGVGGRLSGTAGDGAGAGTPPTETAGGGGGHDPGPGTGTGADGPRAGAGSPADPGERDGTWGGSGTAVYVPGEAPGPDDDPGTGTAPADDAPDADDPERDHSEGL